MFDIHVKIDRRDAGGVLAEMDAGCVVSYQIDDAPVDEGLPLGAVSARRFHLVCLPPRELTPQALDALRVRVSLYDSRNAQAVYGDKSTWSPFGEWFIASAQRNEETGLMTLEGADAFATYYENSFTDSARAYPQTLGSLVNTLCLAAMGVGAGEKPFYNDSLVLPALPKWPLGVTLRRALGCCALLSGGFFRIGYDGALEWVSVSGGREISLNADQYIHYRALGGSVFALNAILYRFEGENFYTRFACDKNLPDDACNCLRAEGNPFMNKANLTALVSHLQGLGSEGGEVEWTGEELIGAGDVISLTDTGGETHRLFITQNRTVFDEKGLRVTSRALMPTLGKGGGERTGRRVFNADGTINFEAVGGISERVTALSGAYIASLTAGDIRTNGLMAKFIEAARLQAASVSAQEVSTDALTAALAEIVSLSVRKIDAGTLQTDELMTALVNAFAVKAEQMNAGSLSTDRLAAALARFQVLTAGTAEFDRATVSHMVAQALNLKYGALGEVYIENLAADYAKILHAGVSNLCVKASDGAYYLLNVDPETGAVTAESTLPNASEIDAGVTASGRTILESEIDASLLNASDIKAVRALINRLDAARIDTDTLTARQAFIDSLNTRDITSNSYLRLALKERDEETARLKEDTRSLQSAQSENEPFMEELRRWLVIDEEGLKQGKRGSVYSTLVNERGFHIYRRGKVQSVGSFDQNGLSAPGITLGSIQAIETARGGWAWQEKED